MLVYLVILRNVKYTRINLQTLQDEDMILLSEKKIRGGISSVMGDRFVKSDDNKKVIFIDANNLYGHSMSQPLSYGEIKFGKSGKLKDILDTSDDSDIGYFVEVDSKYPDKLKEKKQDIFHVLLEIKKRILINLVII